jgi:hypothetical protein
LETTAAISVADGVPGGMAVVSAAFAAADFSAADFGVAAFGLDLCAGFGVLSGLAGAVDSGAAGAT